MEMVWHDSADGSGSSNMKRSADSIKWPEWKWPPVLKYTNPQFKQRVWRLLVCLHIIVAKKKLWSLSFVSINSHSVFQDVIWEMALKYNRRLVVIYTSNSINIGSKAGTITGAHGFLTTFILPFSYEWYSFLHCSLYFSRMHLHTLASKNI